MVAQFLVVTSLHRISFGVCVGSNTSAEAPCLELEFEKYGYTISFPSPEEIEDYAKSLIAKLSSLLQQKYSEVLVF